MSMYVSYNSRTNLYSDTVKAACIAYLSNRGSFVRIFVNISAVIATINIMLWGEILQTETKDIKQRRGTEYLLY